MSASLKSDNIPELPPAPPRESIIATAIKFLQNPRVSASPMEEKKQFLIKKGLTEEEISIAISRAGIPTNGTVISSPPYTNNLAPAQPVTVWMRIRQYSTIAVIVGGVVYGLYSIYKRFIEPIFIRSSKDNQKKLDEVEEGVKTIKDELARNMHEIRSAMQEVQEKINSQTSKLSQVSADVATSKADSGYSSVSNSSISELKAEITSIKGLLLSRNQFPSHPLLKPVIPSWQLKTTDSDKSDDKANHDEDASTEIDNDDTKKSNDQDLHSGKTTGSEQTNGFSPHHDDVHVNGESQSTPDE